MSHTTMSLPALYKYAKDMENIDIFSGLTVPSLIDRSTLIDLLLMRSAPFEVLYPNPTYLQAAITTWSITHARTFDKWADALQINYDPLNNYDRTEEMRESGLESRQKDMGSKIQSKTNDSELESAQASVDRSGSSTSNSLLSTQSKTDTTGNTTNQVSAYDSSAWSNADKSDNTGNVSVNGSDMQTVNGSDAGSENSKNDVFRSRGSGTDEDRTDNENESALHSKDYKLRAFGNIGVTTSQQMLQSELDIDAWNIYEHIADIFLDEFCVLLY